MTGIIITQEQSLMHKSALKYAEAFRYPVFPLLPSKKTPIEVGGFHTATTDTRQLNDWWAKWPDANIGIPTGAVSGFIALDIDPRHSGNESLDNLTDKYGVLPDTVEAITGSGGRHVLFNHPGCNVQNSVGLIGKGLDIRGDGGYIVVAPSMHPSGRRYEWELSSHPGDVLLAEIPDWLFHLVSNKGQVSISHISSNYWHEIMQGVGNGKRNHSATQILGHLLGHYVDPFMAWNILEMWNDRNDPSMSEKELQTVLNSIFTIENNRRRKGVRNG